MMNGQSQENSDDDVSMDMQGPPPTDGPLFWSMKLTPDEQSEIEQPAIEGYIVHITSACFGPNVTKGSRTVVMVDPNAEDDEEDTATPVCVLRAGQQENQSLDLLFNESASFSLKGAKVSNVFLTGYIQPPVDGEPPMDPMYEDMDEEQIMSALRKQREQAEALDADEEEEVAEPPAKKQKTATGAVSKKSPKANNADKKRKGKNAKKAQATPEKDDAKESAQSGDEKKEKEQKNTKQNKKNKKKDKKKMQSMSGLQYRDMKEGDGAAVKKGDKLRVFYVGQTDDKKVFDKCINGSGFEFTLGKGDVIKGWDIGFRGMKVGGKRKLVIPAKLAYGTAGSPPSVPGNAQLTFTVELKGKN